MPAQRSHPALTCQVEHVTPELHVLFLYIHSFTQVTHAYTTSGAKNVQEKNRDKLSEPEDAFNVGEQLRIFVFANRLTEGNFFIFHDIFQTFYINYNAHRL